MQGGLFKKSLINYQPKTKAFKTPFKIFTLE